MRRIGILLLIICFTGSGCAATSRTHADFSARKQSLKTIAVMPPQIKMFQYQAGGTAEQMDAWNAQVTDVVVGTIHHTLSDAGLDVRFVDNTFLNTSFEELWIDTEVLYEAIAASAYAHTLGKDRFPARVRNFQYSLGEEIAPIADYLNADTFLFVYGYNYISTTGRVTLKTFNMLASLALSAALRGIFFYYPEPSPTFLSMGLVDGQTGDLLWYKIIPPDKRQNFLKTPDLIKMIQWMLKDITLSAEASSS